MTFTVAFLILLLGVAIGWRLPRLLDIVRARYRGATYKPAVLRRVSPDELGPPH